MCTATRGSWRPVWRGDCLSGHDSGWEKLVMPLARPWRVGIEETGERQLFIATSPRLAPREGVPDAPLPKEVEAAEGADEIVGSGGYLVNWNGEVAGKPIVERYMAEWGREDGLGAHDEHV